MALLLVFIGAIFLVAGVRDKTTNLASQLQDDFTGHNNFFVYCAALFAAGAVGYIPQLRNPSRALMSLILIVQVLSNKGFFAQFVAQLSNIAPSDTNPNASGAAQSDPTADKPKDDAGSPTGKSVTIPDGEGGSKVVPYIPPVFETLPDLWNKGKSGNTVMPWGSGITGIW